MAPNWAEYLESIMLVLSVAALLVTKLVSDKIVAISGLSLNDTFVTSESRSNIGLSVQR